MNNGDKNKEESNSKSSKIGIIEYEYCKVCRINHNKGAKHKYFPSHKNSLSSFLSKSLSKISQIRSSLHNPNPNSLLDSHDHRFWCVFCDSDIIDQQPPHSAFPRSNAIHHLASIDHLKNLKHFMWKYGSGHFQIDAFMISQSDLAKWEKKCKSFNCESAASSIGPCLPDNNGDYNSMSIRYRHIQESEMLQIMALLFIMIPLLGLQVRHYLHQIHGVPLTQ